MKLINLVICIFAINLLVYSNQTYSIGNDSADVNSSIAIESEVLRVMFDKSFPRIIHYEWKSSGDLLFGQEDKLTHLKINGELYSPKVTSTETENSINYILEIPEISVEIKAEFRVVKNIVEFNVTQIEENGTFKLSTFEIPDHNLLSVRSNQPDASFSGAKMYTAVAGNGDHFIPLTEETESDSIPVGFLYSIVNTKSLAASIWSNSVEEKTDKNRVLKQTVIKDTYRKTGIWCGSWIYRADGMTVTDPLPKAKIVLTNDANSDNTVDWQDGAIAFRSIMNIPLGSDKVKELVVQRIPMNFASQATNPFTKTLDETKRISLYTDSLGQYVILKGYGSEGHDSKHPDYGDIGKRQGGAKDMEMLCKAANKYNAFMGVHINGTESYTEAAAFGALIDSTKPGWDWLDASFYINKRLDASSNMRMKRLQSLKEQVPSLDFIYCDVWYAKGSWDSRKLGREIQSLDLVLTTEFPMDHEYDAVWNHWAVDFDYGGKNIKGFNSQIVRFIRNHQKDTWIAHHPLLGGSEMKDYEGWQGRNNIDSCIWMTFNTGLPTKYLQHFPILKWEENFIELEGNVSINNNSGNRTIIKDGRTVLDGDAYLLPWNPISEEKLYHWNSKSATSTWVLPKSWSDKQTVKLYQLSDTGRLFKKNLEVKDGKITILAEANTPYVVYKNEAEAIAEMNWGEGTMIKDPGFNSGNLKHWNIEGSGASVVRNEKGQHELLFAEGAASVSQDITGLEAGSYYASVYVSTSENRKATLGVTNFGGSEINSYSKNSLWKNYIAADSKSGTNMQRMYAFFEVPEGQSTATISLSADEGSSPVIFDDVRVVAREFTPTKADSIYFAEDFENNTDGLFPFIKGPSGGINDPRTHLSERNDPYTQKGWNKNLIDDVINGNWSLKVHGEPAGLILQTIPQALRFEAGKTYEVSFNYEATSADYALVLGEGVTSNLKVTLPFADIPTASTFTFIANKSGNSWVGIEKLIDSETDFVLDDLIVIEK